MTIGWVYAPSLWDQLSEYMVKETNDKCVTFLPLHSFDHCDGGCWLSLTQVIQDWLITVVVNCQSQGWTWGHELFWMAFIATYPSFPQGSWLYWNARIAIEGVFIQGRIDKTGDSEIRGVVMLHKDIWGQFCWMSLYYPSEVVQS